MNVGLLADEVRSRTSAIDVAKALGLRVNRDGRCACPMHNGRDANMKVYKDSFYCFVCHAHGDVIHLVRGVLNCGFLDAIQWLNQTFNLGLDELCQAGEETVKRAEMRHKRQALRMEIERDMDRVINEAYILAQKAVVDIEADIDANQPNPFDAEWPQAFCEALQMLPEARDIAEDIAIIAIEKR